MAKKKEPSVQDGLKAFKDAMHRASLSDYFYVNQTMLSKNQKDKSILIVPELELWKAIMDDEELKKQLRPIDPSNPSDYQLLPLFTYGDDMTAEDWIEMDPEILYAGKVFKIRLNGFEYEVAVNRDCLPLKLKKAEYNEIKYKLFAKPSHVLAIKKYFPFPVADCGFTMIRLFQVI